MKYYGKFTDEHDLITVAKGEVIATQEIAKALDPQSGSTVDIKAALTGEVADGDTGFPTGGAVFTALQNIDRLTFQVVDTLPAVGIQVLFTYYVLQLYQ